MSARYTYTAKSIETGEKFTALTIGQLAKQIGLPRHDIPNGLNYTGGKWPFEYKDFRFSRKRRTKVLINKSQDEGRKWIRTTTKTKREIAEALGIDASNLTRFEKRQRNLGRKTYKALMELA